MTGVNSRSASLAASIAIDLGVTSLPQQVKLTPPARFGQEREPKPDSQDLFQADQFSFPFGNILIVPLNRF